VQKAKQEPAATEPPRNMLSDAPARMFSEIRYSNGTIRYSNGTDVAIQQANLSLGRYEWNGWDRSGFVHWYQTFTLGAYDYPSVEPYRDHD
jgi:hypothetical protein